MTPTTLLLWSLGIGLTAAGSTMALRATKWVHGKLIEAKKPWACDICMSFWTVAFFTLAVGYLHGWDLVLAAGPAYPVSLWTLRKLGEPLGPPPMPELEDDDVASE
jgi:hypothetical protein